MLEESLDWSRIEAAAAPSTRRSPFGFDSLSRRAIGAALVAYVDETAAPPRVRVGGDPAARAVDPATARRIQHHVAALCRAAGVAQGAAVRADRLSIDVAALDREAAGLRDMVGAMMAQARDQSVTPGALDAFVRLIARLAMVYEDAGGVVERPAAGGRAEAPEKDAAAEADDAPSQGGARGEVKPDRSFIKFLRTLLLDAEEVLLGLPEEPALRRADGSFARRVRSAMARRPQRRADR